MCSDDAARVCDDAEGIYDDTEQSLTTLADYCTDVMIQLGVCDDAAWVRQNTVHIYDYTTYIC